MAKSAASTRVKPIEQFILAATCRTIEECLDLAVNSVKVRTREEAYDVFVGDKDKTPEFPFAFLTYTTVSDSNRFRPNVPARGVFNPRAENLKDKEYATAVIPVTMGMMLEFYTDDYLKALKFLSDTKFMQHNNLLDFTLKYRGIAYTVEGKVGSEITVPVKSRNGPDVSAFVFNVDVTIEGFMTSDGGKYDTKRRGASKLVFTAQLNDVEGEILFTKEINIAP